MIYDLAFRLNGLVDHSDIITDTGIIHCTLTGEIYYYPNNQARIYHLGSTQNSITAIIESYHVYA